MALITTILAILCFVLYVLEFAYYKFGFVCLGRIKSLQAHLFHGSEFYNIGE